MDFTSRKLVRRARIRRNHERQVRVAAVKSRKRTLQSSADPLAELAADEENGLQLLDGFSNSTAATTTTTVPSLPALSGTLSLTVASTTSKRNSGRSISNKNGLSPLQQQAPHATQLGAAATCTSTGTTYPGNFNGGSFGDHSLGKSRQRRLGGTRRGEQFDESVSDSNVPTEGSRRRRGQVHRTLEDKGFQGSGHCSDSTVSTSTQRHRRDHQELGDDHDPLATQQRVYRKHGRVRPQGADVKRKRARQLEKLKFYGGSKIESVLEEEMVNGHDSEQLQRKDVDDNCVGSRGVGDKLEPENKQSVSRSQSGSDEKKDQCCHAQPVIGDMFPSNPPSPTISRMVRRKTEALNVSENTLQQIKEMSSHLRIVNWLWDSRELPLQAGRKAKSLKAASPGASTTVTTNSDNLVVVRRGTGSNWFDWPRENLQEVCRQEQPSPVSINSEFKSDYEDELMSLV